MDEVEQEPTKEQKIWQVVAAIPQGKGASYGQVAAMAGLGPGSAPWASCMAHVRCPWRRPRAPEPMF